MKKSASFALLCIFLNLPLQAQKDPSIYYQNAQKAIKRQDYYHALLYLFTFKEAAPEAMANKSFKQGFDETYLRLENIVKMRVDGYDAVSGALSRCNNNLSNANINPGFASTSSGLGMSTSVDTLPAIPSPPKILTYPMLIKGGGNIKIDFYYSSAAFDKPHLLIQFPSKWTRNAGRNLENIEIMPAGSACWLDRPIRDSEPSCIILPVELKDIRFTSVTANPKENQQFSMFVYKGKLDFLNALADPKRHLIFNVFNNGRDYFVCPNGHE